MSKVVFFDFFGVISTEVAPIWFEKYYTKEESIALKKEIVTKADLGIITLDEMFEEISLRCGMPAKRIRDEWFDLVKINDELVEFIKGLRPAYKVYVLSNAPTELLRTVLEKHNLTPLFDKIFISGEFGLIKPSKEFFEYCLKESGEKAEDAFMTDDNSPNIVGAKNAGIAGVVFTDNETFFRDFKNHFGE